MGKGSRNRSFRSEARKDVQARDARRVVTMEINKELAKATDRFFCDEASVICWVLHQTFGFGKDRIKRFYFDYKVQNEKLKSYYAMSDKELPYLTKKLLKDIGADLDAWDKEILGQ